MSGLLIVGQSPAGPGRQQRRLERGWPITETLDAWLTRAGFSEGFVTRVDFTNVCHDFVPDAPSQELLDYWRPAVDDIIRETNPALVMTLGRVALREFYRGPYDFDRDAGNFVMSIRALRTLRVLPFPHPSGRNRFFNSQSGKDALERMLLSLYRLRSAFELDTAGDTDEQLAASRR